MAGWSLRTRAPRHGRGLTSHRADDRQRAGAGADTPPARRERDLAPQHRARRNGPSGSAGRECRRAGLALLDMAVLTDRAMVTVYVVEGLTSMPQNQSVKIDYRFKNLPGPVVFSAYGYIGTDPLPSIYHTNRAFVDANDSQSKPVSTFAVTIPGDVNRDLRVDFADLAELAENWMIGTK